MDLVTQIAYGFCWGVGFFLAALLFTKLFGVGLCG